MSWAFSSALHRFTPQSSKSSHLDLTTINAVSITTVQKHIPLNATRGFRRQHSLSGSMIAAKMSFSLKQHERAHYNLRIRPSSVRWSTFLLCGVCHQAFWTELLWESCWRKMCLPTLTHTWHAHPHDGWLTQMQGGINVRDQLHGLNLALTGCGVTPHAVCVTASHGKKLQRSRTLGQRVMLLLKHGLFPVVRLRHACGHAQRNSQHPLPSSSRGCQKYWVPVATHSHTPRIHTVNRKIAFFLCLTNDL